MVAVTVFLAATLLFIGLFNQTIQTAVLYQHHRAIATKCSDLLDSILLNPGARTDWGQRSDLPTGFGLQDPEFTQYRLSPFSLMRLRSSVGAPVYYEKTNLTYSNITMDSGNFLLMPYTTALNYSMVSRLLGVNNTYGFQLTLTPAVTVSITETHASNPLRLSVNVVGTGFPLAHASVSYNLILVSFIGGEGQFPGYTVRNGMVYTDEQGFASLEFADVTDETLSYSFIAYAHLSGLNGVGYLERVSSQQQYIIPFVGNLSEREVFLAHSYDVHYFGPPEAALKYNATFVILAEDFSLREVPLDNATGMVNYGEGYPYGVIKLPTGTSGILIITYRKSANEGGIVMMPWGLGSLAFPLTFGGNPTGQEWVATDMRQVLVSGVTYQAKLALWSLEGYQVNV
jgi:hypothetical protein